MTFIVLVSLIGCKTPKELAKVNNMTELQPPLAGK